MANKIISTFFTDAGMPKTGLSPTVDIWELHPTNPLLNTHLVVGGAYTEIGGGWYRYDFGSYDVTKNYVVRSDGGPSLSPGERYHAGANDSFKEEISYSTWEESVAHMTSGTFGELVNSISTDTTQLRLDTVAILNLMDELLKYSKNRTKIDVGAKTLTVYDNDGTTPIRVFQLKDTLGSLSVTEVTERNPV